MDWFPALAGGDALSAQASSDLQERGFTVIHGPVSSDEMAPLVAAYDAAVASATGADIRHGTTTTRVSDFVNRGPAFDALYMFPPLLHACYQVIGQPFKLSSLQARTLRAGTPHQGLHVDVPRHSADWPLVGFIVMIDAFHADNGATAFVPGSHRWSDLEEGTDLDARAGVDRQVLACGEAGSVLIFDGSTWHGHSSNTSSRPRRSLQGAFIPRGGRSGTEFAAGMRPETRARLSPLAHQVLAL